MTPIPSTTPIAYLVFEREGEPRRSGAQAVKDFDHAARWQAETMSWSPATRDAWWRIVWSRSVPELNALLDAERKGEEAA